MKLAIWLNLIVIGNIKRRMLDLGFTKGTKIVPVFKSPFGDPTAFEVRGSVIALRKEDSCLVMVENMG